MKAQRGSRGLAPHFIEKRCYRGVGGQRHAPVALTRERNSDQMVQEAWWAPLTARTGAENLDSTGVQPPDRLIGVGILIADLFT
jgi:hypothetical protein